MSIARGVRGPARVELLRSHRLTEFIRIFNQYCQGEASVDAVRVRALKLKEMGRKRRYLPQRASPRT